MISWAGAYLTPWLIGLALVRWVLPLRSFPVGFFLQGALAVGIGFGLTSLFLFLWLLGFGQFHPLYQFFESALALGSLILLIHPRFGRRPSPAPERQRPTHPFIEKRFQLGFFLFLFSALILMTLVTLHAPHGDWDAWAIWNLRARFLFRAGPAWKEAFSPLLTWSHPDYPLLLPLSVARCWFYLGREGLWVPAFLAVLFSLSVTVLLITSLALLRSMSQGYWGGILLLSTLSFLTHGASQYADLPLSFFFLAVFVLWLFSQRSPSPRKTMWALCGFLAGLSAWTKNEGLLFVALTGGIWIIKILFRATRKESGRVCVSFFLGLLPVLAVILYFKFFLSPPGDLFPPGWTARLGQNWTTPDRWRLILGSFFTAFVFFGGWPIPMVPLWIGYFLWAGRTPSPLQ